MMLKNTTLCYIEHDGKYLMLYRNKKKKDINQGKWIGVGGHQEENESIEECLLREVYEETGLKLLSYQLCGKLHFYIDDLYEICYLYTSSCFEGDLIDCDEGRLEWISKDQILQLNLWEGDPLFLKKLLNQDEYFEMELIYKQDQFIEWRFL
ncbi:8-oxo-dGTP diphosphatase [bacterium]|nr:8-oxo-dGTP diphosphatase [bacterium]